MTESEEKTSVLLVEDDPILRENYTILLSQEGFSVESCDRKPKALQIIKSMKVDIYILDISLDVEREAGFELCQMIRASDPRAGIIFLTERSEDADRISALRLGADDFLSKTTSSKYLVARLHALIRRIRSLTESNHPISTASNPKSHLRVDEDMSIAYWKGVKLDLSLTQYWILTDLFLNRSEVRSINQLMKAAKITVQANTISSHVKSIRSKIQTISPDFSSIKSERARGYRWLDD